MFDESTPTEAEEPAKDSAEKSQDPSPALPLGGPGFTAEDAAKIKDVLEQIRRLAAPQPPDIEVRLSRYTLTPIVWPRAVIY